MKKDMKNNQSAKSIKEIQAEIKSVSECIKETQSSKVLTYLTNRLSQLNFELNCALNPPTL